MQRYIFSLSVRENTNVFYYSLNYCRFTAIELRRIRSIIFLFRFGCRVVKLSFSGFVFRASLSNCAVAALHLTSRRLGEVGGSTAHNSDNHRRLKDTPKFGLSLKPPISPNRLLEAVFYTFSSICS